MKKQEIRKQIDQLVKRNDPIDDMPDCPICGGAMDLKRIDEFTYTYECPYEGCGME